MFLISGQEMPALTEGHLIDVYNNRMLFLHDVLGWAILRVTTKAAPQETKWYTTAPLALGNALSIK